MSVSHNALIQELQNRPIDNESGGREGPFVLIKPDLRRRICEALASPTPSVQEDLSGERGTKANPSPDVDPNLFASWREDILALVDRIVSGEESFDDRTKIIKHLRKYAASVQGEPVAWRELLTEAREYVCSTLAGSIAARNDLNNRIGKALATPPQTAREREALDAIRQKMKRLKETECRHSGQMEEALLYGLYSAVERYLAALSPTGEKP